MQTKITRNSETTFIQTLSHVSGSFIGQLLKAGTVEYETAKRYFASSGVALTVGNTVTY